MNDLFITVFVLTLKNTMLRLKTLQSYAKYLVSRNFGLNKLTSRCILVKPSLIKETQKSVSTRKEFEWSKISNSNKPPFDSKSFGHKVLAVSSAIGLGSLGYYGFIDNTKPSTRNRSSLWQDYVKWRIQRTFGYFGGSAIVTSIATSSIFKSRLMLQLINKYPLRFFFTSIAFQALTGVFVLSSTYTVDNFINWKDLAWFMNSGMMGLNIFQLCSVGGTLVIKAFIIAGCVITSVSALAICAPDRMFLSWSMPLGIGLAIIFACSIGAFLIPQTTTLGMSLFAIYCYGGILLFSLMILYDFQRVILQAERKPLEDYGDTYDPINAAMSLYLDALNIFVRVIQMIVAHL